jgi:hypothetical protein
VAAHINQVVHERRNQTDLDFGVALTDYHPNPERRIIEEQNLKLAMRILGSLIGGTGRFSFASIYRSRLRQRSAGTWN